MAWELVLDEPGPRVLAADARWARGRMERMVGLIGKDGAEPGSALIFCPARQIHTFGMRFAIDVVFCNAEWKVLKVVRSMVPRRMTRPVLRARYAIELPAGAARGVEPDMVLRVGEVTS